MQYCTFPIRTPRYQDVVYIFISDVFFMSTDNSLWKWKTESGKLKVNCQLQILSAFLCVSAREALPELWTDHTLYTLNYTLYLGVPLRVGLSAISLLAFCFLLAQKNPVVCCPLSVVCCLKMLAKDAAPIPNALEAPELRVSAKDPHSCAIICTSPTRTSKKHSPRDPRDTRRQGKACV